jgi:hypothetical protein
MLLALGSFGIVYLLPITLTIVTLLGEGRIGSGNAAQIEG